MTAPGTASAWVLQQVSGPLRRAPVLHAGPSAIHLVVGGSSLGVLAEGAVGLPCGVRTRLRQLPRMTAEALALVGHGRVRLPGLEVRVHAGPEPLVPALRSPPDPDLLATLRTAAAPRLADVRDRLPRAPLAALDQGDPAAVPALLGLGPGLTPLGDDVLTGWLAAAVAVGHPALGGVRDAVARTARTRTTTLSATLLDRAGHGESVPELCRLLQASAAGDGPLADWWLHRLIGVGGTSGAGLALGALTALQYCPGSPPTEPPPRHGRAAEMLRS